MCGARMKTLSWTVAARNRVLPDPLLSIKDTERETRNHSENIAFPVEMLFPLPKTDLWLTGP